MNTVKSWYPKTLITLILAALLAVSPLFISRASASSGYYSVTGAVTDTAMSTITVLNNGRYRTFSKEDAQILHVTNGIAIGDTVKIIFHRDNPDRAVQIVMISHSDSQNRKPHEREAFISVSGVVTDATMSTITISGNSGTYTFAAEDAQMLNAPDGIALMDNVKIVYNVYDGVNAAQIIMLSQGPNHDTEVRHAHSGDISANRSLTGWVSDMDRNTLTVQDLQNGMSLTFYYYDSADCTPDGIAIGDVVKVLYNDNYPGTARRIIMVDQGNNH